MRRHPLRASALLLGASVALGACGSDSDDDAPDDPIGTETPGSVADDESGDGAGDPPVTDPGSGADPSTDGPGEDPGEDGEGGEAPGEPEQGDGPTEPGTDAPPTDGGAAPGDSDSASLFGTVVFTQTGGEGDGEASAGALFFAFPEALPIGEIEAELQPPADSCTVERLQTGPGPDIADLPDLADEEEVRTIDAGEAIVVSGPAGTYATLTRLAAFDSVLYVPEGQGVEAATVTFPVPSGLTLDIPGGDFPAFAGVAVPDVAPLTGVSPTTDNADENDRFVWDAAGGEARVEIELLLFGAQPVLEVTCSAIDDGEFELPQSVRDEIPDGQPGNLSMTRTATRVERGDGAVLLVRSEASES